MFTIRTRYVCVLSLLLSVSVLQARGMVKPNEAADEDSVTTTVSEEAVPNHDGTINPYNYSVQDRYLEESRKNYPDSIKWFSRASFGVFSGATAHAGHLSNNHQFGSRIDFGRPLGVSLAYHIRPMHAVRLLYENKRFGYNFRNSGHININEFGVGYMFGLTNYFKGFDPNKRLTIYATATAFGTLSKSNFTAERKKLGARGEFGLLFDYRFWKNMSAFIEPYFGLTTDDYDLSYSAHRYDFLAGARAGILVSTNTFKDFSNHVVSHKNSLYNPTNWFQNVFFGSSYGRMWTNAERPFGRNLVDSHVYLGYRLSPIHALRIQATYFKTPESLERKHHIMGEVDYMTNLTNMWRGYEPDRKFRTSSFLGFGLRYLSQNRGTRLGGRDRIVPMVTGGLAFNYYILPQFSVFLEPWAGVAFPIFSGQKTTVFGGLRGGFQVDLIDTHTYMPHYAYSDEEMQTATLWKRRPMSHFFFGASGGITGVHNWINGNYRTHPFNAFIGYRFTPVQSLRFQMSYIKTWEEIVRDRHLKFELDYMLNFSNLIFGYNPNRRFNLIGYVGVGTRSVSDDFGKPASYATSKPAMMFTTGADLMMKVYKGLSIFVEPYAGLVHHRKQRYYIFDYGVNGGFAVNFDDANLYGRRVNGDMSLDWERKAWRHLFVGGGGGIMGVHTLTHPNEKTYPMNIFVGYRFTPNQAIRLKGGYIRSHENMYRKRHLEGEVDYMLNFTNAFAQYKPNRLLNVIGFVGVGAKYLNNDKDFDGQLAPMATMGVDLALRIKRGLSVYVEPYLAAAKAKHQNYFTMYYGANAGLALNFEELYAYSPRWGRPSGDWISKPQQRLFFGAMAGWLRTQNVPEQDATTFTMFAGYRFSPIHALRAKATLNGARVNKTGTTGKFFSFGVDYMFNATNMICGYNPERPINFIGFVGLGARDMNPSRRLASNYKFRLMGNAGMDIAYRLTRNVNIFVEPYVGATHSNHKNSLVDFFMGVNGGVTMNLEDIGSAFKNDSRGVNLNPFFEASYGWMFPINTGGGIHNSGLSLDSRVGIWLDPLFGLRGSLTAQNYGFARYFASYAAYKADDPKGYVNAMAIKARIEALFNPLNLSSAMRDNEAERKFDLNLAIGFELGGQAKKYALMKGQDKYGIYGFTAAMQLLYKFNYNTALYLEPRYERTNSFYRTSNFGQFVGHRRDNLMTLNAGVRVMRGTKEQREDEPRLNFEQTMFFSLIGGGYKAISGYKVNDGGRLGWFGGFNFGFLITPLHGVKFHLQPSWYKASLSASGEKQKFTLMDYRLLYMLNFSNLYQSEARRKIDAYIQAGPVLSTIMKTPAGLNKKCVPGFGFGFLVAYNINKHWAITSEPMGHVLFKKSFLPGYGVKPRMGQIRPDISIGTMFKF